METRKQDRDAIAEEAVGQRHEDPPPYAVKEQPDMSQEEMAPAAIKVCRTSSERSGEDRRGGRRASRRRVC